MNLKKTLSILVILLISLTGFAQKKVKKREKSHVRTQVSVLTKTKKGTKECNGEVVVNQNKKQAKKNQPCKSPKKNQKQAYKKKKCRNKKAKSFWVNAL